MRRLALILVVSAALSTSVALADTPSAPLVQLPSAPPKLPAAKRAMVLSAAARTLGLTLVAPSPALAEITPGNLKPRADTRLIWLLGFSTGTSDAFAGPMAIALQFPTVANKIHVLDCTVGDAGVPGTPIKFATSVVGLANGSSSGSTAIDDGHALYTFTAKGSSTLVTVFRQDPVGKAVNFTWYGCDLTRLE